MCHQLGPGAGTRHHGLEAERARFGRGRLADCKQRQGAGDGQCRTGLDGAQRIAAGRDERLRAVEIHGLAAIEGYAEQGIDGGLVAHLFEHAAEFERIRLGPCDEEAHIRSVHFLDWTKYRSFG